MRSFIIIQIGKAWESVMRNAIWLLLTSMISSRERFIDLWLSALLKETVTAQSIFDGVKEKA
jgi:hypothetical protein